MTPDFQLRSRMDADIEALAGLWVATWQEAMPNIDFIARRGWFCEYLDKIERSGARTICAVDGRKELLGFVSINPTSGYLDQIAVMPKAKGSGVANALLAEAKWLSPMGIVLDVNQDNARALRFYAREGFKTIGEGVNAASGLKTWRLRFKTYTNSHER